MRRLSLLLLLPAALAVAGGCGTEADRAESPDERGDAGEGRSERASRLLVERLRGGGHVLAFRHAATETAVDTTDDLGDCSKQRNLSAAGRRQSRGIGHAIRRLRIPVGRVLASPFCRARDTARLAFGRVRTSRSLLSVEFFANADEARRKGLRRLLGTRPRGGANTVLVSHGSAIYEATRANPDEGEAVVIAPGRGTRDFALVGSVKADEWRELGRSATKGG